MQRHWRKIGNVLLIVVGRLRIRVSPAARWIVAGIQSLTFPRLEHIPCYFSSHHRDDTWLRFCALFAAGILTISTSGCGDLGPHAGLATGIVLTPSMSWEDRQLLEKAEMRLIGECMRGAGFQYFVLPPPLPTVEQIFPYGIDDPIWASQHGYGSSLEADLEAVRSSDPNASYVKGLLSDRQLAYGQALNGGGASSPGVRVTLPDGGGIVGHSTLGCGAEAEGTLYGDFKQWFVAKTYARILQAKWQGNVLTDAKYRAALVAWSDCMLKKGYRFASPLAARTSFVQSPVPRVEQREKDTAGAEAHCSIDTGLASVAHQLDAYYSQKLPQQDLIHVEGYRRMSAGALARARTIVSQAN